MSNFPVQTSVLFAWVPLCSWEVCNNVFLEVWSLLMCLLMPTCMWWLQSYLKPFTQIKISLGFSWCFHFELKRSGVVFCCQFYFCCGGINFVTVWFFQFYVDNNLVNLSDQMQLTIHKILNVSFLFYNPLQVWNKALLWNCWIIIALILS